MSINNKQNKNSYEVLADTDTDTVTTPDDDMHSESTVLSPISEDMVLLPPNMDDILYKATLISEGNSNPDITEIFIAGAMGYINSMVLYLQSLTIQLITLFQTQMYIELGIENNSDLKMVLVAKLNSQIIKLGKKIAYYNNNLKIVEELFSLLSSSQNGGQYTKEELSKFQSDEFVFKESTNPEEYQNKCKEILNKFMANEKAFNELNIFEDGLNSKFFDISSFKDIPKENLPQNVVLSKEMADKCDILREQIIEISKISERKDISEEEKSIQIKTLLEQKKGGMLRALKTAAVAAAALSTPGVTIGAPQNGKNSVVPIMQQGLSNQPTFYSSQNSQKNFIDYKKFGVVEGAMPEYSKFELQVLDKLTESQKQLFLQQQKELKDQSNAFLSKLEEKPFEEGNLDIDMDKEGSDLKYLCPIKSVFTKKIGDDGILSDSPLSSDRLISFNYTDDVGNYDSDFEMYSQYPDRPISLFELKPITIDEEIDTYKLTLVKKYVKDDEYAKNDEREILPKEIERIAYAIGNEQQEIIKEFNSFYENNKSNPQELYKYFGDKIFKNPVFSYDRRFRLISFLIGSHKVQYDEPSFKANFGNKVSPSKIGFLNYQLTGQKVFVNNGDDRVALIRSTKSSAPVYINSPLGELASSIARVRNIEFTRLNGAIGTVQYDVTEIVFKEGLALLENILENIDDNPEDPKYVIFGRWLKGETVDAIGRAVGEAGVRIIGAPPNASAPSNASAPRKVVPQLGTIEILKLDLQNDFEEKPLTHNIPDEVFQAAKGYLKLNMAHIVDLQKKDFELVKKTFDDGMNTVKELMSAIKTILVQQMRTKISTGQVVREDASTTAQSADEFLSYWTGYKLSSGPVASTVSLNVNPKISEKYLSHLDSLSRGTNLLLLGNNQEPPTSAPTQASFVVGRPKKSKKNELQMVNVDEGNVQILTGESTEKSAIDNFEKEFNKLLEYLPTLGGGVSVTNERYLIDYGLKNVLNSQIDEELLKLLNEEIDFQMNQELTIILTIWPDNAVVQNKSNQLTLLRQDIEKDFNKYVDKKGGVESSKNMPEGSKDEIINSAQRWATFNKMKLVSAQLRTVFDKTDKLVDIENTQDPNKYIPSDINGNPVSFYGKFLQSMTEDRVKESVIACNSTIAVLHNISKIFTENLTPQQVVDMISQEKTKQQNEQIKKRHEEKINAERVLTEQLDEATKQMYESFKSKFANQIASLITTVGEWNVGGFPIGLPLALIGGGAAWLTSFILGFLWNLPQNLTELWTYLASRSSTAIIGGLILLCTVTSEGAFDPIKKLKATDLATGWNTIINGNVLYSIIVVFGPVIVGALLNEQTLTTVYPPQILNIPSDVFVGTAKALAVGGFWFCWKNARVKAFISGASTQNLELSSRSNLSSNPNPSSNSNSNSSLRTGSVEDADLATPVRNIPFGQPRNQPRGGKVKAKTNSKAKSNKIRNKNKTKKPKRSLRKNEKAKSKSKSSRRHNKKIKPSKKKKTVRNR
jgi:hypothetical protein